MATIFPDTSEQAERVLLEALRKKSPGERLELAADATECLRKIVRASIRWRYPQASEEEVLRRFAARWLGREWAMRVYGWDPEQHGW